MKYFAKIELNNKVTAVLYVDDSVRKDADGNDHSFINTLVKNNFTLIITIMREI